jgi:signal transduction histidine kinase
LSSPKKRVAWDLKAVTRVLMSLIFCNRCLSSAADCCVTLMMNSIDAMKDVDEPRELTIQSQRGENRQVWISVSDTGVGLPPQQADKIF